MVNTHILYFALLCIKSFKTCRKTTFRTSKSHILSHFDFPQKAVNIFFHALASEIAEFLQSLKILFGIKKKQWVLLLTQRDFLCREVNMCWNSVSMASNTAVRFAIKWEGQREGGVIEKITEGQNPIHKWLKFIRTKKQNWCSVDKRDRKSHTPTLGHEESSLKALTISYLESS